MRASIRNRQPAPDGWYQIEVTGTHQAGEKRRQVIDEQALASIVARFQREKQEAGSAWPGILVDKDHLSHDMERETEAMAWLQDLRIKDGQLEARLDLTDLGESAVRNRRYKFFSTEYDPEDLEDLGNGDVRPLRLSGLAFTNRPNNRGARPISNRHSPGGKTTEQPTMRNIAKRLGLSEMATEADILAALEPKLLKLEDLEGKEATEEADAILNRFGERIPAAARPDWRRRLIANRADTESLLKSTFGGAPRIFNRSSAVAPAPVEARFKGGDPADDTKANAIRNRAHEIKSQRGVPFSVAFEAATAELG